MWCKTSVLQTAGLGRCGFFVMCLTGLLGIYAPDARAQEELAASDVEVVQSETSEDLFADFERAFRAADGTKRFRIGVGSARALTPASDLTCDVDADLMAGTLEVACENLTEPVDVYLVDNQPLEDDSVLPEAHDIMILIGHAVPGPDGTANIGTDLGADFFSESELDLVVLVEADAEPTAKDAIVALGTPSAFMRQFSRKVRGRDEPDEAKRDIETRRQDPRVRLGLVDEKVLRGAELFFRETFRGNGRTCATCHRAEANLGLDPGFVRDLRRRELARFGGLKDPLFVANPNFIGKHPVPLLEVPFLLNRHAMIRENIDGFEAPARKFTMRGVPHSLSLAPTIMSPEPRADGTLPDGSTLAFEERTGWSGDGAPQPGTLRLFSVGATIQHFRRRFEDIEPGRGNFRLPNDRELDALERFMLTTGRTRDIELADIVLSEPEAEGGRGAFVNGACGLCHANAGANAREDLPLVDLEGLDSDDLGNRNFNTQTERLDSEARQLYAERTGTPLNCDGGFGGQGPGLDDFNFDSDCGLGADAPADGDGIANPDAFGDGRFNSVSLIEAADTGPFFHNNAVDTIEEAVGFYRTTAFNDSPSAQRFQINLTGLSDTAITNIAALLRTLNAGFNLRQAQQRCGAAAKIIRDAIQTSGGEDRKTRRLVNRLVELSSVELRDVRQALGRRDAEIDEVPQDLAPLYPRVRREARNVINDNATLMMLKDSAERLALARSCRAQTKAARLSLTSEDSASVLNFRLGAGNLTF